MTLDDLRALLPTLSAGIKHRGIEIFTSGDDKAIRSFLDGLAEADAIQQQQAAANLQAANEALRREQEQAIREAQEQEQAQQPDPSTEAEEQ